MIFISGGVRSGKSTFAEHLAIHTAKKVGGNLHYIATGVAMDDEMEKRIMRHQMERENSVLKWKTREKSTEIETIATSFQQDDVVLLDCVTTLLNNELFSEQRDWDSHFLEEVYNRVFKGITAIDKKCGLLILVSNEVTHELKHENEMVFHYSRVLGNLHQEIVKKAESAYLVEAGIPILMKGAEV